jgi:UDP-N-acetylmuramoylalanine--D-glutamate ligase
MFSRMSGKDVGIVFEKDIPAVRRLSKGRNRWLSFGLSGKADYQYRDKMVYSGGAGKAGQPLNFSGTVFANEILGVMTAAAVAALKACGVKEEIIRRAARQYKPLPHRMQTVARSRGVTFINDSKATNLAALAAGVTMCSGPVRLIAGGLLKERKLSFVKKTLAKRVMAVYLIGKAAEKMQKAWGASVKCIPCGNIKRAISLAWRESKRGDFVILSPGCASFDQFEDFEDRGKQFAEIVKSLIK